MLQIKICLDKTGYSCKPRTEEVSKISKRIYKLTQCNDISTLADLIGNKGHTFTPAVFDGVARKAENVTEIQLLCLDFDNDISKGKKMTISFEEATERSYKLGLPIAFAYETFSSENRSKFRIVYTYCEPIVNHEFYSVIINALHSIFPESDSSTKDISRLFFGGKGLLTGVSDKKISGSMIFSSLYYHFSEPRNEKKKKIENFALSNCVELVNGTFHIDNIDEETLKKVQNAAVPIIYNNRRNTVLHDFFIIYKNNTHTHNQGVRENKVIKRRIPLNKDNCKCSLLEEFANVRRLLNYHEKWGILTNLVRISGGIQWFTEIMSNIEKRVPYAHNFRKWDSNVRQIKKNPYSPERCITFCPYCNECKHCTTILNTLSASKYEITVKENCIKYTDINNARNELFSVMQEALNSTDNKALHIINAQTGLGKTEEYINCMMYSDRPFIIAVSTTELKEEVFYRCIKKGIENVVMTPKLPEDIDIWESTILETYYTKGDVQGYHDFLKMLEDKYPSMKKYKEELRKTLNSTGHILTTHIRFLNNMFSEKAIFDHEIIIDEDIIKTAFISGKVSKKALKTIIKKYKDSMPYSVIMRLKSYITAESKENQLTCLKLKNKSTLYISNDNLHKIYEDSFVDFNFYDLINAKAVITSDDYIYFSNMRTLPDKKIIMVSATASEFIYKNMFPDRNIHYHEISKVRYEGKIIQYFSESFSRNWIKHNKDIFDKIMKYHDNCNKITFLSYSSEEDPLHFGNTEGKDDFANNDLLVFGTPFHNEVIYKLMAAIMGFDIDKINKRSLNHRIIEMREFEFLFFTYDYEPLRVIQMYFISSEIEQAVGRARLLNNNNTVYVYSCMPVSQAEFHEINPLLADEADKKDTPKDCDSFEEE